MYTPIYCKKIKVFFPEKKEKRLFGITNNMTVIQTSLQAVIPRHV